MGVLFKQVGLHWRTRRAGRRDAVRHVGAQNPAALPLCPPALQYLSSDRVYTCSQCKTHCTDHGQLISKVRGGQRAPAPPAFARRWVDVLLVRWMQHSVDPCGCMQAFQGRHGRAYLFSDV